MPERMEFGNSVAVSSYAVPSTQRLAEQRLVADARRTLDVLMCVRDMAVVEGVTIVEGPNTDKLRRFKPYGWRLVVESDDYGVLKQHFACHKQHVPQRITLRWLWQQRRRWALRGTTSE